MTTPIITVNIMPLLILPSLIFSIALQIGLAVSPPEPASWPIPTDEPQIVGQQSPVASK